jgi:hypothetical protein
MTIERVRALWKKALPYAFGAVVLGTAGTAAANHYLNDEDCCKPGAACCKPGAACCHHGDKDPADPKP